MAAEESESERGKYTNLLGGFLPSLLRLIDSIWIPLGSDDFSPAHLHCVGAVSLTIKLDI